MTMPNLAKLTGILLILLGSIAYLATGAASITALIPTFFGIPMFFLGYFGDRESVRKHLMHAAAILALLGFFGSMSGLPDVLTMLGGGSVARPEAAIARALMAIICLMFLVFAVRSFIAARSRQQTS